ncbi:MAG: hypothetical protein ACQES5_04760 [Thermodesulfobacteriota bacterium]
MDYKQISTALKPLLANQQEQLQAAEKTLNGIKPEGEADKKNFLVLKSLLKNIQAGEQLKQIAREIIENDQYFSSPEIEDAAKQKSLKKILDKNKYLKNSKLFNISIIQGYIENIVNDKLHEINIKIEENQRFLHRMAYPSSGGGKKFDSDSAQAQYIFVQIANEQYAVPFKHAVEILKLSGKKVRNQAFKSRTAYKNISGLFHKNLLKKLQPQKINHKSMLENITPEIEPETEANFAIIFAKQGRYYILFTANILNLEPVEAQNLGDYVETLDGVYQTIGIDRNA